MKAESCTYLGAGAVALAAALLSACGGGGNSGFALAPAAPAPDAPARVTAKEACDKLNGKTIGGAAVTAEVMAATTDIPLSCRVSGKLQPSLNFELRLPNDWNGKFHYRGGGGYNGSIPSLNYYGLRALQSGYATVSSDSGHQGANTDASFALNNELAARLFGNESVPTVTAAAVSVLSAAYGRVPTRKYFEGCSNGGREGLMVIQRNPDLFDGVIAAAPAYNWVGFIGHFHKMANTVEAADNSLTRDKIRLVASAVRASCDALDGVADGIVSNQKACNAQFNYRSLRCPAGDDSGSGCLSDNQLTVLDAWTQDAVYQGSPSYRNSMHSLTGNEDSGGFERWVTGANGVRTSVQFAFADTTVKNYLARDPSASALSYKPYDQNLTALDSMAALNDATNPDLRPFKQRGGKLILWHGSNDAVFSPENTARYYEQVKSAVGGQGALDEFVQYYEKPGVEHCWGGPGADYVDHLKALDSWVSDGAAPKGLVVERRTVSNSIFSENVEFSRPLCKYPGYARYVGPANDAQAATRASNFVCTGS